MNRAGSPLPHRRPPSGPEAGFTLVELMISMVLGLFIVLALVTLLINVNRNNSELAKTNRIIENGRFALQLLQADLSHAGYWGGFVPQFDELAMTTAPTDRPQDYLAVVTAVPDPCANWADLAANADPLVFPNYKRNLIGISVQAYGIPAVVPSPTVPVCGDKVVAPQPNTDVVFLRHVETCAVGETGCTGFAANELYFQVARCGNTAPSPAYALAQYNALNENTLFPLRVRAVAPLTCATAAFAEKRKYVSNLYYVRRYAVTDGDNVPTLMRRQFSCASGTCGWGDAQAMIEGIESFKVELGIDNVSDSGATLTTASFDAAVSWLNAANLTSPTNRGDGFPDTYVGCTAAAPCSAFQLMNTVAVKIYILARSENKSPGYTDGKSYCLASTCPTAATKLGPFDDGYKRHLFQQVVRLVNVSGRRETP